MIDNLTLWNQVRTPDPEHTKKFQVAGGFKGTSTDAMYLVKRATEVWGQIGMGWGYEEEQREIVHDVWYSYVRLWYQSEMGKIYSVYHWGGSPIRIINKDGKERIDDEAAKKAFTNGMSKCLSQLGFAADIYMGLFDDDKYVNDARKAFEKHVRVDAGGIPIHSSFKNPAERGRLMDELIADISVTDDIDTLKHVRANDFKRVINDHHETRETFQRAEAARKKELAAKDLEEAGYPAEFNDITKE